MDTSTPMPTVTQTFEVTTSPSTSITVGDINAAREQRMLDAAARRPAVMPNRATRRAIMRAMRKARRG